MAELELLARMADAQRAAVDPDPGDVALPLGRQYVEAGGAVDPYVNTYLPLSENVTYTYTIEPTQTLRDRRRRFVVDPNAASALVDWALARRFDSDDVERIRDDAWH